MPTCPSLSPVRIFSCWAKLSTQTGLRLPPSGTYQGMEHRLPYAPTAPGMARKLAADFVSDLLPAARSDEFVLVVSEIVGNAVRHGNPEADGRIGLRLRDDDSVIQVAVVDGAPRFTFDRLNLGGTNGRPHFGGLRIVDELADRWGLSLDGLKAVWFEVDR